MRIMTEALAKLVPDEQHMLDFGTALASVCGTTAVIFLQGNLGVGKTTLARGFLRGLGYAGKVKSPTYTIVEPYDIKNQKLYHFDFYRIQGAQELEYLGIQDYLIPEAIALIEWPEHGVGLLPGADLICWIDFHLTARQLRLEAHSNHGHDILRDFISKYGE
jgi:tRNA threonylcarbamoyladenosine biosynthesis protein TsaE